MAVLTTVVTPGQIREATWAVILGVMEVVMEVVMEETVVTDCDSNVDSHIGAVVRIPLLFPRSFNRGGLPASLLTFIHPCVIVVY